MIICSISKLLSLLLQYLQDLKRRRDLINIVLWPFTPHLLSFIFWGTFAIGLLTFRRKTYDKWDEWMHHWVKLPYGQQRTFWYSLLTALGVWALGGFIALVLGALVLGASAYQSQKTWEYRDQPLVSLRTADSINISGSFFVFLGTGAGDVKGEYEPVYVYYIKTKAGLLSSVT